MQYKILNTEEDQVIVRPNHSRLLLMLTMVFGGSFYILLSNGYLTYKGLFDTKIENVQTFSYERNNTEKFAINTKGCTIPAMDPFDDAVIKYVDYPTDLPECPNANFTLVQNNRTHIWINNNADILMHYNVSDINKLKCCYSSFYRPKNIEDIESSSIDDRVKYSECRNFTVSIKINEEFVRVTCTYNTRKIYDHFFVSALKKDITSKYTKKESKDKVNYNVIILGIDAVSRLNFHRTFPKTLNFLLEKGAIELMGYNKVGDNSFPNLAAFLMGYEENELKRICHPFQHIAFDACPFLWHWFNEAGFYTAFGEDSSYLGTYNYLLDGFARTPTDYYLHTFIHQAEKEASNTHIGNTKLCMNNKYFYKLLLEYVENLTITLEDTKLFGFFWEVSVSHDYLNYPMIMDNDYVEFLERLEKRKYLEKSVIIIMSDHGIRWGGIRSTKQGRYEESLPFIYILTPPSFKNSYKGAFSNLKVNSRRLTTPFDMHETLLDLIDLNSVSNKMIATRMKEPYALKRGISLFLPIPTNRTCTSADIPDHYCTCHTDKKVATDSEVAKSVSNYLVKQLNSYLKDYPQCATLEIVEILDATEMVAVTKGEKDGDWVEYLIVIKTNPGGGIFEATLRKESNEFKVTGTVSRLNLYGDQSWCVEDRHLKLYCYCLLTV